MQDASRWKIERKDGAKAARTKQGPVREGEREFLHDLSPPSRQHFYWIISCWWLWRHKIYVCCDIHVRVPDSPDVMPRDVRRRFRPQEVS
nr:hypothetical protein CFP56_62088 [Quercus suber]